MSDGFRSLKDGEDVEFYQEEGTDGRRKAVQVTGPNGAPPIVSTATPVSTVAELDTLTPAQGSCIAVALAGCTGRPASQQLCLLSCACP